MWRFMLLFCAAVAIFAATAGVAPAEVIYYTEDFEDNGKPGFDPMFNHEFTGDPGIPPSWFIGQSSNPDHFGEYYLALLRGTTDTITFNIKPSQTVVYGAAYVASEFASGLSARFVGSEGSWQTGPDNYDEDFVEITAAEIGNIERIELYSVQSVFLSVTIGVVPEPNTIVSLLLLAIMAALYQPRTRQRRV